MLTNEELNNLEEFNGPEKNGVSANADAWEINAMVRRIKELEAENARLRQQRDSANAQLDFILETLKCDTPSEQNSSSQG